MIRKPVVAGRFYPDDADELIAVMDNCERSPLGVRDTKIEPAGRLLGLIMPHAGYIFSGPVATWGMKRLAAEQPVPTRLLLLGPKHTPYGSPAAISAADSWKTPLGSVTVDDELRQALRRTGEFEIDDDAHAYEHSLEVQLPFLQKFFGKTPFTVTPVALAYTDYEDCRRWGTALAGVLTQPCFDSVTTIISSDFSHETPRDVAYRIDGEALDVIQKLDDRGFFTMVRDEDRSICGVVPITAFMNCIKGLPRVSARRLAYSTSMDVMSHPAGVGYACVAFEQQRQG